MKRPANPNTLYGRRRIMEEQYLAKQQWANENPEEAKDEETNKLVLGVIIFLIIIILVIILKLNGNGHYVGPRGGHYHYNSHGNKQYE